MSRHRFLNSLAAFIALLALATAFVACGGGEDGGGDASAEKTADEATLRGIESGQLDLKLNLVAESNEGGDIDITLSGPFQGEGKGEAPQLDLTFALAGILGNLEISLDTGLVLVPDTAYINFEGVDYKVDPITYKVVAGSLKQEGDGGADASTNEAAACQDEAGKLKIGEFIDGASSEPGPAVGGVSTTKVSGDLDVGGAIDALAEVAESPACRDQLDGSGPLPSASELEGARDDVESVIQDGAEADLYVDDDGIVRRVGVRMEIDPEESGPGPGIIEVDLDLQLTEVNEKQEISAPENTKPLGDLFQKLGIDPIELLQVLEGEGGLGTLFEKGLGGALAGPQG